MLRLLLLSALFFFMQHMKSQVFQQMEIPDTVWQRMQGKSYPEGCPVKRSELRYLRLTYCGVDGKDRVGEMVCNKSVASKFVEIFRELHRQHYVIERMQLIDDYDADDVRSMEANNTSCFCYRAVTGGKTVSKHGRGLAIDINPLYNPYVKGNKVSPPSGRRYAFQREKSKFPMKITLQDACYKLFVKHGFKWGGAWRSCKDYQHFEM